MSSPTLLAVPANNAINPPAGGARLGGGRLVCAPAAGYGERSADTVNDGAAKDRKEADQ
jgi:hypothetical protein